MKIKSFLKTAALALAFVTTTTVMAQQNKPFKGTWFAPDMYIEIDFHDMSISDPNSMDGDPCAGIIKVKPEVSSTPYTIENVKINGNKATATSYMAEGDSKLTFELLPGGDMKMTSSNGFAYIDDELKKLPSPQSLAKASPFAGVWKLAKGDGTLTLNLHDKSIMGENFEANNVMCYGTIYTTINGGMRVDNDIVTARKINGNQAVIYYQCGRSGNEYSATLIYNPTTKRITIKNPKPKNPDEAGDCHIVDGMVFNRAK